MKNLEDVNLEKIEAGGAKPKGTAHKPTCHSNEVVMTKESKNGEAIGGGQLSLQPENGEPLEVTQPRFLKDDLGQLVALGLFSVEYNSDGNSIFGLTRNGMRYIQAIDGNGPA